MKADGGGDNGRASRDEAVRKSLGGLLTAA